MAIGCSSSSWASFQASSSASVWHASALCSENSQDGAVAQLTLPSLPSLSCAAVAAASGMMVMRPSCAGAADMVGCTLASQTPAKPCTQRAACVRCKPGGMPAAVCEPRHLLV